MPDTTPTLKIHVTNDPIYMENGFTVHFSDGGPCWFIDPGLPPQAAQIADYVKQHALKPQAVILTHAHGDHIGGVDEVREAFGTLPVYLAKEEWAALSDPKENLSGMMGPGFATQVKDPRDLAPGDELQWGDTVWSILDVSGHSPGGRALYNQDMGIAFVGDALFQGSVGRVDFHHSNGDQLMGNIHAHLMTLPDDTRVLSGHGPETTIGRERVTNPFVVHGL